MFWMASLAADDPAFLEKWRDQLKWETLPKGPMQYIVAVELLHWDTHSRVLDAPALLSYLDDLDEGVASEISALYLKLREDYEITDSSRPTAWERAEEWIQNYYLGMALDRAREALSSGNREKAFSTLLGLHEVTGKQVTEPITFEEGKLGDILRLRPNPNDACRTGIWEFDNWWEGGLYPGNLGIVLAPTNLGKSMALAFLATSAYRQNKRILYFTYELTTGQVVERLLTALFECSKDALPQDIDYQFLKKREEWGLTRASLVVDEGIETVADLKNLVEESDVDLVLLDSADDMHAVGKHENTYTRQGEIYTDIHQTICMGLKLPVWTSTQATREAVEKSRLSLKHMGDSFIKARRAHIILGMSQSQGQLEDPQGPLVNMYVLKDTLHGTRGKWGEYVTKFGKGKDGFPGFSLYNVGSAI